MGCRAGEVIGDMLEVILGRVDPQEFESAESVGSELEEWVVGEEAILSLQPQVDWGGL